MLILTLVLLCGLTLAYLWSNRKLGPITSILLILGMAMTLFALDNYWALGQELELTAQNLILLAIGLPGVILAALGLLIPRLRRARNEED